MPLRHPAYAVPHPRAVVLWCCGRVDNNIVHHGPPVLVVVVVVLDVLDVLDVGAAVVVVVVVVVVQ